MDTKTNQQSNKKQPLSILDMTQIAIFAAIIYLTIAIPFLRVPVGTQMVHFGNPMVLIGALVFGSKKGAISASIGLFLFDATHGWLSVAWITVLESVIVCIMVHIFYEKMMKSNDKVSNVVIISLIAAITKIILNLLKYTFLRGMITQGLALVPAFTMAVAKITGTFGSAILTVITVPLLYPVVKKIVSKASRTAKAR